MASSVSILHFFKLNMFINSKCFILLFFCFFIGSSSLKSQNLLTDNSPKLNFVFSSPTAASIARYGEVPVGLYTGIPNISVPIYTIDLKGIKIPITISYHAGGIKTDDIASNVGLGWTLNCGGAITDAVNGICDYDNQGWLTVPTEQRLPQNNELNRTFSLQWLDQPEFQQYKFLENFAADLYDSQPDLFSVNLNGRSFKFFIDQDFNVYTVPLQRIKFTKVPHNINTGVKFEIVDEQDVVYNFDAVESSTTNYTYTGSSSGSNTPPRHTYSFYLTKITTPQGEIVNFSYEADGSSFNNRPSETRYSTIAGQPIPVYPDMPPVDKRTESTTIVAGQRLSKVYTNTGVEINFTYGMPRKDIGVAALTNIEVKEFSQNTIISNHSLNYSYFESCGSNSLDPNCYRLKLLSIQKAGENPTLFDYEDFSLPKRLTGGQDHYGYFNYDGNAVTTLLPADPTHGFPIGASRDVVGIPIAMLKKISYSTGGQNLFEYEPNVVNEYVIGSSQQKSASAEAETNNLVNTPFTVNTNTSNFKVYYNAPTGSIYDPETGLYTNITVLLKNNNGTIIRTFSGQSPVLGEPVLTSQGIPVPLSPGNYNLEINTSGNSSDAFAIISWDETVPAHYDNRLTGGLRIKTIASVPINSSQVVKHYEYTKQDNQSQSSGSGLGVPVYNYIHQQDFTHNQYGQSLWNAQSSSSISPIGRIQGGQVAYSEVVEYTDDKANGYTVHKFSNTLAHAGDPVFPFAPIIFYDWIDGLPIETTLYNWSSQNGIYQPIQKTMNSYKTQFLKDGTETANEHVLRGAKIDFSKVGIPGSLQYPGRPPEFSISSYNLYSSWMYQTGKTETIYDPIDTMKQVITKEKYYYDNPDHIERTRTEVSKSTGENYNITMRYPKDYDANYPHNSSPVVEKRVMINSGGAERLVTSEITTYKNQPGALPLSYYNLKNTATMSPSLLPLFNGSTVPTNYEKRLDYTYDNNNLVQTVREGVANTTYLWGYNYQYPIAEIKNVTYQQVVDVLGQSKIDQLNSNPGSDQNVKTLLAPLRTSSMLKDAQVTTYTFSPLVGMTSMTDAKGQTTYYEYDNFQRLKNVKDSKGNIIRQTDYHYQNQ